MSAFMCSTADFSTLATFAIANGCGGVNPKGSARTLARVANVLGAENARSVNYRYAHNADAQETFELLTGAQVRAAARDVSAAQIVKLCDCVNYQSCETPEFKDSEAFALLNVIRAAALAGDPKAARGSAAYEAADWGF